MKTCNQHEGTIRVFQGGETRQVDGNTGASADPALWYYEPEDYEGDVLYSQGYASREEAERASSVAREHEGTCEALGWKMSVDPFVLARGEDEEEVLERAIKRAGHTDIVVRREGAKR